MAKLKLSAPWYITVREFEALFNYDEEVHVVYDEETLTLKLYVDNADKAAALAELLPTVYEYGTKVLAVEVIPANESKCDMTIESKEFLYEMAFEGNPIFSFARSVRLGTNTLTYVVFLKMVVQFFIDDLSDAFGNRSTLYQEIAKDIFGEEEGVSFCTDVEDIVQEEELETISCEVTTQWP